jgi:hypothetical protein
MQILWVLLYFRRRQQAGKRGEFEAHGLPKREQGPTLNLARGAQTGVGQRQIGIVVARMRDQFPGARGQIAEQGSQSGSVKISSGQHADRTICGYKSLFGHDAAEGGLEAVK